MASNRFSHAVQPLIRKKAEKVDFLGSTKLVSAFKERIAELNKGVNSKRTVRDHYRWK